MSDSKPPGGPLAGRRIVVTRTRSQAGTLAAALAALGAEVIEVPAIEVAPPVSYAPLDEALRKPTRYDWLVVTSANAVRVIGERLQALGLTVEVLAGLRCAAAGAATAEALGELGLRVDLVPDNYVAESLADALTKAVAAEPAEHVLLVRAAVARDVIPEALRRAGVSVDEVDAYRTVLPAASLESVKTLFAGGAALPDAVTFTSSSTVVHFFGLLRQAGLSAPPAGVAALSIGPVTSATLREHGWEPAAEADPHDVAGLVKAAVRALSKRPGGGNKEQK